MFVTSLAALAINVVQAGTFNKEITIALIGFLAQAVVAYIVPNNDTPGGVPLKYGPAERKV